MGRRSDYDIAAEGLARVLADLGDVVASGERLKRLEGIYASLSAALERLEKSRAGGRC